jgi:hypothetical protein
MKERYLDTNNNSLSLFYGLSWPLIVGILACVGLLTLSSWHTSVDPDTYMHLSIGQWILAHRTIPAVDIYSHTMQGGAWTAHEWLSECIFAAFYDMGAWSALVMLVSLMLAFTLGLLLRFLLQRVPPIYAIFFTAIAYSALANHLLIRPHVLSWPLLLVWCSVLINAAEKQQGPPLFLLLVMTLWANLHGSFVFGLAITIPIGAQALWDCLSSKRMRLFREWALFWIFAVGACMLTPLGWKGLFFPFSLFKLTHLDAITEWMPYQFIGLGGLEITLASYFVLALMGYIQIRFIHALLIVGMLYQALTHNRYVSIFGLITPLLIASSFGRQYSLLHGANNSRMDQFFERASGLATKKAMLIGGSLIVITALISAHFHRHEPSSLVHPIHAVDFAVSEGISGPVLNTYEFGGYLISRGIPVFIDGRADLYDQKVLGPYLEAIRDGNPIALDGVIQTYGITWVLIRPDSMARGYFDSHPQWKKRYEDQTAVIFTLSSSAGSSMRLAD